MSEIASFAHAGATLVAETSGTAAGAGAPTFVLIHGIGMGRSIFADLVEHLGAGAPVRTIAIDLPGYGEAPEPARVLTMERTADLVAAYLRSRAIERAIIIGHSMGTQVAVEVAARHPASVERLVLVAPTVNRRERTAAKQVLRLAQDLAVESPRVIFVGAREYIRAGPHLRAKFRAMLVHRPETTYPRVLVPVLVLRGENDYVCPRPWSRFVTASLPDGRSAEVPDHGHETMIRDAAPAAALIREFVGHG
ncbi:MAG: alpha/beta hydrolase [Microbacterium sp.]